MPLSKQAKALYEAALRRKGLQSGKAVRQDPRTFVGPIDLHGKYCAPRRYGTYSDTEGGFVTDRKTYPAPSRTYWNHKGRFQDLEDELSAAIDAGIWERRNPVGYQYYRYYNDGDIPRGIVNRNLSDGYDYNDMGAVTYRYPVYQSKYPRGTRRVGDRRELTRLGQLELEARADEMIENDYKDYLKKMLQRFPNRAAVREQFPEEYNAMPYLEDLFPEE